MESYKPIKQSSFPVNTSPSAGDLVPSLVQNGSGGWENKNIPYESLKGDTGSPGADGQPGQGVPNGGTTGQVLQKSSNTDYDTQWTTMTLNKAAVGLSNVDNTSDANKPVSTATQAAIDAAVTSAIAQSKQESYPVGSLYFNADVATNPATLLGFGTWVAHAAGRVPVGKAPSGTFATAGATGGVETHTHTLNNAAAMIGSPSGDASRLGFKNRDIGDLGGTIYNVGSGGNGAPYTRSHNTALTGSTDSTSHLQPYVVVYIWKRTA